MSRFINRHADAGHVTWFDAQINFRFSSQSTTVKKPLAKTDTPSNRQIAFHATHTRRTLLLLLPLTTSGGNSFGSFSRMISSGFRGRTAEFTRQLFVALTIPPILFARARTLARNYTGGREEKRTVILAPVLRGLTNWVSDDPPTALRPPPPKLYIQTALYLKIPYTIVFIT